MLSDPRVRMLFGTIRNLLAVFGLVYIAALFSTLHTFYFIFFALGFIGLIYLCYRIQIAFREVFGGGAPEINEEQFACGPETAPPGRTAARNF